MNDETDNELLYSDTFKKQTKKKQTLWEVVHKIMLRFQFVTGIHRSKRVDVYQNLEIWNISIPDNPSKKGDSGGYRLLCIKDGNRNEVLLYSIWQRSNLTKQHIKKEYSQILQNLKRQLKIVQSLEEID
ncbi:MAG: hypothetical protein OXF49_00755 [Candidatus Saccharibacteria bacterium]|nr:hypothetical protein [Candidatus Saccharibacteria bacterium]